MLGLVSFVALLPVGLVSFVGGIISDRFPRRKLILITQTLLAAQALLIAIVTWAGRVQIWHIIAVMFIVGAADALEQPARFAFMMEIVGKEDFTNAVGLNSFMVNIARSIGPVVAGVLIGRVGEAGCFFVNFVTYLAIISAFLLMRLPPRRTPLKPMHLKNDLLEGLKYIWQNQTIKGILLLIFASILLSQPYMVLMPVFARDVLLSGSRGYGLLMSAIGLGAICGALFAASVEEGARGKWLIRASIAFSVLLFFFAFSQWMSLSFGLLLLVGASQLTQQVLSNSSIQLASTDEFHGRVASFFALFNNGLTRLGGIQSGAVAQYVSPRVAIAGGALISLVWLLVIIWRTPSVRRLA